MKTVLFDFELPEELIAVRPLQRGAARMLVVDGMLADHHVCELPQFLRSGDLLILNDTKVIPARLIGKRGTVSVEILLHKKLKGGTWQAFAKPAKRLKVGDIITIADDFVATVKEKLESGEVVFSFTHIGALEKMLVKHGAVPLPPYIEKKRAADAQDKTDYQTVFAAAGKEGAVAAPTAGLHFTDALFAELEAKGVSRANVTLHVGGGTFLPVKVEDTKDHVMHSEYAELSAETANLINETKAKGGRIVAVGTTSLRTLESATDEQGITHAFQGETAIFITPGYRFKCVDVLMTNFHLPCSTLFMLVSAFSGLEEMQRAYAHAIASHYRFYSYGDACLLYKKPL